ncbi:MAG: O-antigen ligase family protein [Rhodospirillaceae bacterium]
MTAYGPTPRRYDETRQFTEGAPARISLGEGYRPLFVSGLTVAFLLYSLVGTNPFPNDFAGDTSSGSPLSRLVFLGLLGVGSIILWERRDAAFGVLKRNWLMVAVLGWLLASMVWSDHPGLTVRRSGFLIVGFLIALAIAVGTDDPGRFLKAVAGTLFVVLFINLVSVFAVPHLAVEELGARGMHPQKNTAGAVAMLGFVALVIAGTGVRRLGWFLALLGALAVVLMFMVLTKSKTSLGLSGIFLAFILPVAIGLARGRLVSLILLMFAFLVLGFALLFIGALGWGWPQILEAAFGDETFTGRTDIWEFAFLHIWQRPFLGTGYGAFWDVGAENDPLRFANSWLRDVELGVINQTHNGYVDLWLQAGLPALFGGILITLRGLWVSGKLLVRERDSGTHWSGPGIVFATLSILTVYNLMESALLSRVHFLSNVIFLLLLLADRWSMSTDAALRQREQDARVWER